MAHSRSPASMRAVTRDLRRDWGAWSAGERFTASLVGVGVLYLALILFAPGAATLPW